MVETWQTEGAAQVRATDVAGLLRAEGFLDLRSSRGRILFAVTNHERAMVVLMEHEGDAGRHLGDPSGTGVSDGYVLDNGQVDEYPDADTVDLTHALEALSALVDGTDPETVTWVSDG